MDRDWAWLGRQVRAARAARTPKLSQDQLADQLDLGRSTVQAIERGKVYKNITPAHRTIAEFFGWASIEDVLAGGEPANAEAPGTSTLPLRVAQAIAGPGALIDTAIIPLPGIDEPDGEIVVIVKGKPTASPEEIRRAIDAWERTQDRMRTATEPMEPPTASEA